MSKFAVCIHGGSSRCGVDFTDTSRGFHLNNAPRFSEEKEKRYSILSYNSLILSA
jgi:hypothetical protein